MGHKAGNHFFKKFLLKKSTNGKKGKSTPVELPMDLPFEELEVIETFLKHPEQQGEKRMIEQSVVREGSNRAFTYTHKTQIEIKGQIMIKKRAISAAEYVELES